MAERSDESGRLVVMAGTQITRDDALEWLHDRLGQRVLINLSVDCGDGLRSILSSVGELRQWSAKIGPPLEGHVGVALRETFVGLYMVGGCGFDIGDPRVACEFTVREANLEAATIPRAPELVVGLPGGSEITITHASADAMSGSEA